MKIVIKKKSFAKIVLAAFVFFYLYLPPIINMNIMHIVAVIAWMFVFFNMKKVKKFFETQYVMNIYALLCVSIAYMFVICLIRNENIYAGIYNFIMWGVEVIPICITICCYCQKNQIGFSDLLEIICFTAATQGIFAIISYFDDEFHQWVTNQIVALNTRDAEARWLKVSNYRLYGLAYHLTNYAPITVSVIMTIAFSKIKNNVKYLLCLILMSPFAFLNSRTSLLLSIGGIMFVALYNLHYKLDRKVFVRSAFICVGLILTIIVIVPYFQKYWIGTWNFVWLMEGIQSVVDFLKGDAYGYFGYLTNKSKFLLPKGLGLLFGTGTVVTYQQSNLQSDVGYINYIWKGGLVYLTLIHILYLKVISPLKEKEIRKMVRYLYTFCLVVMFILNIKDSLFGVNEYTNLYFLLSFSAYFLVEKSKR